MGIYITMKQRSDRSRVTPEKFLSWAEKDIKGGDRRAIANALTNTKRALHARIDEILYAVRARYANDWPDRPDTDSKLRFLKSLKIQTTNIANVLTNRRNDLEHHYVLPPLNQVRADVQTGRLWLDNLKSYLTSSIVLAGLPIESCYRSHNVRTKKKKLIVTFSPTKKILFFCDIKRKLITLKSDGTQSEIDYNKLKWKELVRFQQPYLSIENRLVASSMSIATKIYNKCIPWINMKGKLIQGNLTVSLPIDALYESNID